MASNRKAKDTRRRVQEDSRRRERVKKHKREASTTQRNRTKVESKTAGPKRSRAPISKRRLWAFRIITATLGPILVLVMLEAGLRLAGYGYPTGATLDYEAKASRWIVNNEQFGWRFFPANIARELEPFALPAVKPQGTYRIFVLGSSAAQGIPDASFNIGRILETMLTAQYPGVNFEVATLAMSAVNSHVIRAAAKDLAKRQPDMFVVYLGNNEAMGLYGPGQAPSLVFEHIRLIRANIALKSLRLGQLITGVAGPGNMSDEWEGMETFAGNQIRSDDPRLQTVYSHYQENLEDICDAGLGAGAKVVLCTVGGNLKDCAPFACLHREDLSTDDLEKWQAFYDAGIAHEQAGEFAEACEQYKAAEGIDIQYADLHFRMGKCLWSQEDYTAAREHFIRARELDTLRFRADSQINAAVRKVADKAGESVALVDAETALAQESPEQTPGQELFWEHVHLNVRGNYVVGRAVFEQVRTMLPDWVTDKAVGNEAPSEDYCRERLAYTSWDERCQMDEVLNGFVRRAPFTNQLYNNEQVRQLEEQLTKLNAQMKAGGFVEAAERHKAAIAKNWRDWRLHYKYGKLLAEDLRDYKTAADEYRTVIDIIGHSHIGYHSLAAVLKGLGDIGGMIEQYHKALELKPTNVEALYYLGWGYQKQGNVAEAERCYRQTLKLRPRYTPAYNNLGEILYKQKRFDDAVEVCRNGISVDPNNAILHSNLGVLLNEMGHREEAMNELHTAERLDPNSARIKAVLKDVLKADTSNQDNR